MDNANYGRMLIKMLAIELLYDLLVIYGSGDTYTLSQMTCLFADVLGVNMVVFVVDIGKGGVFEGYVVGLEGDLETDRIIEPSVGVDMLVGMTLVTTGLFGFVLGEG